jgi:hypothetical protein
MFEPFENPNPIDVKDVHFLIPKNGEKNCDTNVNRKFLDAWALKMPWAEPIFNEIGLVISMKCYVYSKIEKRDKVLVAKWDSIENHVSKKKLMVLSGLWIQNVGMQKMKLFMFNYQ